MRSNELKIIDDLVGWPERYVGNPKDKLILDMLDSLAALRCDRYARTDALVLWNRFRRRAAKLGVKAIAGLSSTH